MLTCRDVHDLGTDYLDGGLSRRQRFAMLFHLFLCRNCRRYIEQLRRTAALLRESLRLSTAPEGEDRLLDAVRAQARTSGDRRSPPDADA